MRSTALAIAMLNALSACSFKCSRGGGMSREDVEKKIASDLTTQSGVNIEVNCPEITLGKANECIARTAGGKEFPVIVTGSNELKYETRGIGLGRKLAARAPAIYRERYQLEIPEPACPPVVLEGETAECVTTVQGVEVRMAAKIQGGEGFLEPRSGLVASEILEKKLIADAPEEAQPATASCGPRLRFSVPGSTFPCTVTDAKGRSHQVRFRVDSADGDVSIVAPTPPGE